MEIMEMSFRRRKGQGFEKKKNAELEPGGQRRDERGEMTKEDTFWGRVCQEGHWELKRALRVGSLSNL